MEGTHGCRRPATVRLLLVDDLRGSWFDTLARLAGATQGFVWQVNRTPATRPGRDIALSMCSGEAVRER